MLRKTYLATWTLVIIFAMMTFSACRHPSPESRAEWLADYVAETLDLTDTQREQLAWIKDELLDKAIQLRADRMAIRKELMVQLRQEEINADQLKAAVFVHKAKVDELIALGVDRLVEFHRDLKPEQRAKLVSKLEEFHRRHDHAFD